MSKLSKAIAVLGVVSALGVSALPLSTYAETRTASEEATVQVKVTDALSIAIENVDNSAAWYNGVLDLGRIAPNGSAEESMKVLVTNNVGNAVLKMGAVKENTDEEGKKTQPYVAADDASMHGVTKNTNVIEASSGSVTDKGSSSGWAYKIDFESSEQTDQDIIQAGSVSKNTWTDVSTTPATLATIKNQVGTTSNPVKPVVVTFGVHAGPNQTPDTYKAMVQFTATVTLDQSGTSDFKAFHPPLAGWVNLWYNQTMNNQAFIDGQNLHMNTKANGWQVDLARFRVYLREKYQVERAYYFIGAVDDKNQQLYQKIQEAGYILVFRKHSLEMVGHKKGNVDTDIVFTVMSKIADQEEFDKVVLVSGDGDYFRMVEYLAQKNRLHKVLAPSIRSMSSLYKQYIDRSYYAFLDEEGTKKKIATR